MFRLKNIHNIKEEFKKKRREPYLCRVNETVCDIDTALPDTAEYTGRDSPEY